MGSHVRHLKRNEEEGRKGLFFIFILLSLLRMY